MGLNRDRGREKTQKAFNCIGKDDDTSKTMRDTCVATFTQSCVIEPHGENTIWTNKDTHNKMQGSYTDYTIDTA